MLTEGETGWDDGGDRAVSCIANDPRIQAHHPDAKRDPGLRIHGSQPFIRNANRVALLDADAGGFMNTAKRKCRIRSLPTYMQLQQRHMPQL